MKKITAQKLSAAELVGRYRDDGAVVVRVIETWPNGGCEVLMRREDGSEYDHGIDARDMTTQWFWTREHIDVLRGRVGS